MKKVWRWSLRPFQAVMMIMIALSFMKTLLSNMLRVLQALSSQPHEVGFVHFITIPVKLRLREVK